MGSEIWGWGGLIWIDMAGQKVCEIGREIVYMIEVFCKIVIYRWRILKGSFNRGGGLWKMRSFFYLQACVVPCFFPSYNYLVKFG